MRDSAHVARFEDRPDWRPADVDPIDAGVLVTHAAPRVTLTADAGPPPVALAVLVTDTPWWCE